MSKFRGFTVSFNSIGAGKTVRQYIILAIKDYLAPLLLPENVNTIMAKCCCKLVLNTRSVYRRLFGDYWVKYQLLTVVAPSIRRHEQAKKLIEKVLPGNVNLQPYNETARARLQYTEFVPDNKNLVFGFQRVGIAHDSYGEVEDLVSPAKPKVDPKTGRLLPNPWHRTERERRGVFLTTHNFPLQRNLNMMGLLDMLLLGATHNGEENQSNVQPAAKGVIDASGLPRYPLSQRRQSASFSGRDGY